MHAVGRTVAGLGVKLTSFRRKKEMTYKMDWYFVVVSFYLLVVKANSL